MKVGIVGCGLIGSRRASAAREFGDEVVIVADIDVARARGLADKNGANWSGDWMEVVSHPDLDIVVVSTVNKVLAPVTIAALRAGKHVLCEKPLGRNVAEAREMAEAARQADRVLKVGFNHRYHPAIRKAYELRSQGAIGPLMFIRAVYGHGGRPGYEKEWRADPDLAGGGELLDQGVHLVDLCRWFMGDFAEVFGAIGTYYWDLGYIHQFEGNGPVAVGRQLEDNAFVFLRTVDGRVAQLHTSWTQWKSRFTFEIFGRDGYLHVNGLGGSYGTETLTVGRRRPEGGVPVEEVTEYPGADLSWRAEWKEFRQAINEGREPMGGAEDGLRAMRLLEAIYESARTGRAVRVPQ